jgi:hypothetical protein
MEVRALSDYKLWLHYDDGVVGEVDLSGLVGEGVFQLWNDYHRFERVSIGPQGELAWGDDLDLCADALYLKLTGKRPEETFPNLPNLEEHVDA